MKFLFCLFLMLEVFDLAAKALPAGALQARAITSNDFVREDCYRGQECYTYHSQNLYQVDSYLGYLPVSNRSIREIRRSSDGVIYDVLYHIDAHSRRTSLYSDAERPYFAAFFGGSFTFGVGLETAQTLSSLLGQSDSRFAGYNYAIGGTGTNTMLALSEKRDFRSQISQERGLYIYVFIPIHVERATGKIPSLLWLSETPYYHPTTLDYVGSFSSGSLLRSLWTQSLLLLYKWVPFVRGKTFPPDTDADYEYVCRMVARSKENFLKQSPDSEFIFYVHPFATGQIAPKLRSCLEQQQIAILESQYNFHLDYEIEIDGHPNGLINQLMATEISKYVSVKSLFPNPIEVNRE